jgi:hypothetical protein
MYPAARLVVFSFRSSGASESDYGSSLGASIEQKIVWLVYCFLICVAVLFFLGTSRLTDTFALTRLDFRPILEGLMVGLVIPAFSYLRKILLYKRDILLNTQSFRLDYQVLLLMTLDGLTDEFWRASALTGFQVNQTVGYGLLATTLAFAIGRIDLSGSMPKTAGSMFGGAVVGGVLGLLFLKTDSLAATAIARVIGTLVPAYVIPLYLQRRRKQLASTQCPFCHVVLSAQHLTSSEVFRCPECHKELRINPRGIVIAKIVSALILVGICIFLNLRPSAFILAFIVFSVPLYLVSSNLLASICRPRVEAAPEPFRLWK